MERNNDSEQKYLNAYWVDKVQELFYVRFFLRLVVGKLQEVYGISIDLKAIEREASDLRDQAFKEFEPKLIEMQNNVLLFRQVEEILRDKNL